MNMSKKVKAIRQAEGLTQVKFCQITGIPLSTLKNYEGDHAEPSLNTILQLTSNPLFEKYTLWLMTNKTVPEAGQIAPAIAHSGPEKTTSNHSEKRIG
ncbi:TPA: helix-turn-helix transcriptional regulator [Yersinia enterocolitica]|uniref:helix-turn-helix domain-containing protein n=1 Tax=Yersinia enterocolitica TaxID=630 RepID=UPI0005DD2185|nr:helix-turn-helix transcriptional regulator [Yersinia enterocolitica]EKN4756435.1 helix-turn-helix transcriptional regulator [Yersinia enterocolitica]ELI8014304.1 helix-turn-helix transcriptional regulator [Yersinia enterocolitica]ELI8161198.1 helix-turn-helix transcriptional regulator [Yersinia enterocolitica]MBX9496758.1 helix-turn-helix transcriptional regulator [Yersinia enterocolitica]UYK01750.1 helix-turn-helix domain-containing protein [Yersinia enterocolitica]